MVWQDAFASNGGPNFDAEDERERRLAAQAKAGAEWALTALIARYQPTVVRYLTRLCGNQAQAQRIAERIFQRMERRLHGPHGGEHLRLWLLRASTEAGLDTLRRPKGAPMPRLGAGGVAGLLSEVSGKDAPAILQHGLRRLRNVARGASQQARPLIWSEDTGAQANGAHAHSAASENHLDDDLDRLDPRDALRHRLVRVTLADMPYGDAQCLALHLVAGLNQAEVARALGITNSAARKRIVHGLAIFSERYTQAVQSLGLPPELGYGDALPRSPIETIEPEPAAAPTPPPPVVVSSRASEANLDAKGQDHLIAMHLGADYQDDPLSRVSYLSEDSAEIPAVGHNTRAEAPAETEHAAVGYDSEADMRAEPEAAEDAYLASEYAPASAHDDDESVADEPLIDSSPAADRRHMITRVAADAIVGPVVDALPVAPADADGFGEAGPHSVPLAYELNSSTSLEAPGVMMRWLDDAGMLTPLSFESATAPTDAHGATEESEPLGFEAVALESSAHPQPHESEPLGFEAVAVEDAHAASPMPSGNTGALGYELAQSAAPQPTPAEESDVTPIALVDETSESAAEPADDTHFAPRAKQDTITQSLEALWDELPEQPGL